MRKIENRFLVNYLFMFFISTLIAFFAFLALDFANELISKTLMKNNFTSQELMQNEYSTIDFKEVVAQGGGVQVINGNLEVVLSEGIDTLAKKTLTKEEFTKFLISSNSKGIPYSYSISYNEKEDFWLIVTFPTSMRIDFDIVHNSEYPSKDRDSVMGVIVAVVILYLLLLALSTVIYSKITSVSFINPLKKLYEGAKKLKEGDYTSRVDLQMKNEFGELGGIFNEMAEQIQLEIEKRKLADENRRKLILDISHDLKNPLANVLGYAERCLSNEDISEEERRTYLKIIQENGIRGNNLILDLFELSKIESTEYKLNKRRIDFCEYMRQEISGHIAALEDSGFTYEFDIPEKELLAEIDSVQFGRVLQNLLGNSLQNNEKGTKVAISLKEEQEEILLEVRDNGIGIPKEIAEEIFTPFVKGESGRKSTYQGTGLGLTITQKIVEAHGGRINLIQENEEGCAFRIQLPKSK